MSNTSTRPGKCPPLDPHRDRIPDYEMAGRPPGHDGNPPEFAERRTLVWEEGKRIAGTSPENVNHSRIRWLKAHGRIDARQEEAAKRLADDWEMAQIQPCASSVMVGNGSGGGDNHPNDRKVGAMRRHGDARDALGMVWPIVEMVVEQNMTVEKASAQLRVHTKVGHGLLWAALHTLADFYGIPREGG